MVSDTLRKSRKSSRKVVKQRASAPPPPIAARAYGGISTGSRELDHAMVNVFNGMIIAIAMFSATSAMMTNAMWQATATTHSDALTAGR